MLKMHFDWLLAQFHHFFGVVLTKPFLLCMHVVVLPNRARFMDIQKFICSCYGILLMWEEPHLNFLLPHEQLLLSHMNNNLCHFSYIIMIVLFGFVLSLTCSILFLVRFCSYHLVFMSPLGFGQPELGPIVLYLHCFTGAFHSPSVIHTQHLTLH